MSEAVLPNLARRVAGAVRQVVTEVRPHLVQAALSGDRGESPNLRHVDFGSVGLCHVAAGFTDAMIEFAKGFAIWDLLPGQYILQATGGVVLDLDGNRLPLDHQLHSLSDIAKAMNSRQKFVAARDATLASDILAALNK